MFDLNYQVVVEYPGDDEPQIVECNTFKYAMTVADEHSENGAIVTIREVDPK